MQRHEIKYKTSGSKNLDEKPHRRGRIFYWGKYNVIPISRGHCSRLQQFRCRAVIEDWMIPFAAYTATDISYAFQISMGCTTPKSSPFSCKGSRVPRVHKCQPPNGISIGLAHLCDHHTDRQTNKQTDHATCDVCSNSRIYAPRACSAWTNRRDMNSYCIFCIVW